MDILQESTRILSATASCDVRKGSAPGTLPVGDVYDYPGVDMEMFDELVKDLQDDMVLQ